jgi:hypothetical protein
LEKVFTNLAIIYSTSAENHLRLVSIIVFISVLKVVKPNVFGNLLLGKKISFTAMREQPGFSELNDEEEENKRNLFWLLNWVHFSMLSESEYQEIAENHSFKQFEQHLRRYGSNRKMLLPMFCQKLSMFTVN